jgi:5'-3' exonuclease
MKLIIVDGNNLGWRATVSSPLTYKGQRTEVIRVGLNIIRYYLNRFEPDALVVCWDGGRDERRLKIYPQYKRKKRKELTPEELQESNIFFDQLRKLQDVLKELGINQFLLKGREADDVIYNLLKRMNNGWNPIVVSTDEDMFQLFTEFQVQVYSPVKKVMFSKDDIMPKFGIDYKYFPIYKAMVGDSSDNIPGLKGIGPATAQRLIGCWYEGEKMEKRDEKHMAKMDDLGWLLELILFMDISTAEIRAGEISPSCEDFFDSIYGVCERYGFDRLLEDMPNFAAPFDQFLKRRKGNESTELLRHS